MLPLNDKFAQDIEQSHVTLYPLVIIDKDSDNPYYISTVKEVIKDVGGGSTFNLPPLNFKDYNLKISNIKESIDIKNHNFKISNVTLTLNNYEIDRVRLSDTLSEKINKFVSIYYKSQSCETLEECLLVYRGRIRRLGHDDKELRIILEDLTESTLHKDVPISNLGTSNCFSKNYLNRYIPITYGYVEKAPAIPYLYGSENNSTGERMVSIISDDIGVLTGDERGIEITGFGTKEGVPEDTYLVEGDNPLYIYKGDYFKVLENAVEAAMETSDWIYDDPKQYTIDASKNFIDLTRIYASEYAQNPTAFNEFQTVKIRFPNELKLLFSPDDEEYQTSGFNILNLMPDSGILNPEGAYDNEAMKSSNIIQTTNPYSTFCQIPNSQATIENVDVSENWLDVHVFTPFKDAARRRGIHYPDGDTGGYPISKTNYMYTVSAWCQTNAAQVPGIKFIDIPSGGEVYSKIHNKLIQDGYADGQIVQPTPNGNTLIHEFDINPDFRESFRISCALTGEEQSWYNTYSGTSSIADYVGGSYFGQVGHGTLKPFSEYHSGYITDEDGTTSASVTYYDNLQRIVSGRLGADGNGAPFNYPTTVYKFWLDRESEHNNPTGLPISYVVVGMYNSTTMPAISSGTINLDSSGHYYIWYNMFPDSDYDMEGLWEFEDRCIYNPQTEMSRGWTHSTQKNGVGVKYQAEWNGTPINSGNYSNSIISTSNFAGVWGYLDWDISQRDMCKSNSGGSANSGGSSWWILVDEEIPSGAVLQQNDDTQIDGEDPYYDADCQTRIRKNTLIPCNAYQHYFTGSDHGRYQQAFDYEHDYVMPSDLNYVNLYAGIGAIAEKRLSFLLPIEPTSSNDVISTATYIHGKLNCETPDTGNVYVDEDKFLVTISATDEITADTNFNAEIPQSGVKLLELAGSDNILQNGGEIMWSTQASDESAETNSQFSFDGTNYKIGDWDTPDKFDSLALTYKYISTEETSIFQVQTNIFSIGLLQYTLFENALDDEFYLDIVGRADLPEEFIVDDDGVIKSKFTNIESPNSEEKIAIENPVDIIYHFIEKELQSINTMNRDSWINARNSNDSINIGFSVKDKINSKKLVEEISKNSFSYPKYDSYGTFSFANINNTYSGSDYQIKSKDVMSYNFKKTPVEDVVTLVNVKYKKDYAEDEYLKSTGYCDAYDFYGNGDLYGLLKADDTLVDGYKYSYLDLEREDNILEFESDYIRELQSAIELRNYLFMQNCNQHTLMSLTLPLKYMHLETGDVLSFDSLINDLKAYGEDYTAPTTRNGQVIYPYFIITSITKSTKNIKLESMQLHKLTAEADFSGSKGSVTRSSELGLNGTDSDLSHIKLDDISGILDFIYGKSQYFTTTQKQISDTTSNGLINTYDVNLLQTALGEELTWYGEDEITVEGAASGGGEVTNEPLAGDINSDGIVNVVDVVALVAFILDTSGDYIEEGDINLDGINNVVDIVAMVSLILGGDN